MIANNGATPRNCKKTEQKRTAPTTTTGSCQSQKCRSNMSDRCEHLSASASPGPMRRSASLMMQQDSDDTSWMEHHNSPISTHPDKKKQKLGW
eukprot:scaffold37993_cov59-Attheya_sp.AAC.3